MPALGFMLGLATTKDSHGADSPSLEDGPLDTLISQGATVLRAFSVRKLLGGYAGAAGVIRGDGIGSPEATIPFVSGALDTAVVAALIADGGGTWAFWKQLNDQTVNAGHAAQIADEELQPHYSEEAFPTGAIGGSGFLAQGDCWLAMNLGTLTIPFAIWVVVRYVDGSSNGNIIGDDDDTRFIRSDGAPEPHHGWGGDAQAISGFTGKDAALFVNNGASSKIILNGSLVSTDDPGDTLLDMSVGRIGCGGARTSWLGNAGQAIAEVVVFTCDPSSLPGWNAFIAASSTYFGTTPPPPSSLTPPLIEVVGGDTTPATTMNVTSDGTWSGSPTGFAYMWYEFDTSTWHPTGYSSTSRAGPLTSGYSYRVGVTASNATGSAAEVFSNIIAISDPP